jgi:cytochrome bd ubiquinol oxidase subunit II
MSPELALAGVIGAALCLYFLFGGADFGGGVWDLLASGPRRDAQRRAIEAAIGPVWEANHVWLILVIVVLFTGFPLAFAAISVALHVPLTLFLVGVVLRGSAFAFRGADAGGKRGRMGLVFSMASTIAPVLLGMIVGALVSGRIRVAGAIVQGDFFAAWLAPFPLALGVFALALCALLAATYLTVETTDPALREDFRRRALAERGWSWPFHALTGAAAVTALVALYRRRFRLARVAVAAQTVLILLGWALAQYPYLIVPDITLADAAASPRTQRLLLVVLAAGVPVLVPSLVLLFRVFKRPRPAA